MVENDQPYSHLDFYLYNTFNSYNIDKLISLNGKRIKDHSTLREKEKFYSVLKIRIFFKRWVYFTTSQLKLNFNSNAAEKIKIITCPTVSKPNCCYRDYIHHLTSDQINR